MALLEVKEVDFRYYGSSFELNGVNLTLSKGDRLVIYGRENSGKTTLLRVLCGLEDYCRGSILLDGVELNQLSQKDMGIGFTFDKSILDGKTLVKDIITLPMKLRGLSQEDIESYLEGVAKRRDLPMSAQVRDLSDIQVAMMILARLFAVDRQIYLVDDVWKDLTQAEKSLVTDYLIENIGGKSAIIATDDDIFAKKVTIDRIIVLTDKQVAPMLSAQEIAARPINMQSAIFAGYELHIGNLIKIGDDFFADINGAKYPVSRPISEVYVGKKVCFAVKRSGELSDKDEVGDGEVMSFYYDIDVERIITN